MLKTIMEHFFLFFFKYHFTLSNLHHSFSKLEWDLTFMIGGTTLVEIGEIHFHNIFEHIWFKWAFGIKCEEL